MTTAPKIDAFTRGYLEAALWTSDPDPRSGEWAERDGWAIANIEPASLARAIEVCADFQAANRAALDEVSERFDVDDSRHGHDFWLTRNRHGAGFWDRGYGTLGARLTDACRPYGDAYCYGPETNDQGSAEPAALAAWDGTIYIHD